ncbi:TPA: chromate transporter, partial [Clostridioides difficile]|nr:chromate transporter [Clostridioides difficile]
MNTIWNLFFIFLKIGLFSIGGGYAIIPLIQEKVVNQTGWISEKMFT